MVLMAAEESEGSVSGKGRVEGRSSEVLCTADWRSVLGAGETRRQD